MVLNNWGGLRDINMLIGKKFHCTLLPFPEVYA